MGKRSELKKEITKCQEEMEQAQQEMIRIWAKEEVADVVGAGMTKVTYQEALTGCAYARNADMKCPINLEFHAVK